MSLTKKKISKIISKNIGINNKNSHALLNKLISIIITNSKNKIVKISGFGTFDIKSTPERLGRNPSNMKSYKIKKRDKLNFKSSSHIKELLN